MTTGGPSYRMVSVFCRCFGPIVLGSVSLACGFNTLPAYAQESAAPVAFDIPSQPLARALNSWAVQAGAQVFFEQVAAAEHTAPAVSGSRAPREALHTLLANSGLDFTQTEEGVFIVRSVAARRGHRAVRGNTTLTATDPVALGARYRGALVGASEGVYPDSRRIVFSDVRASSLLAVPAFGVQR